MKIIRFHCLFIGICVFFSFSSAAFSADDLNSYNVVWDSPSSHSGGSMPIGNGDIGLNVWVERDGDLNFYISKTDAWSGIGRRGYVRYRQECPHHPGGKRCAQIA